MTEINNAAGQETQNQLRPQQTNITGSTDQPSKFDLFSGRHTTALIVGVLYIITLIVFVIFLCVNINNKIPVEIVITGFISLLSGLIGFFAGSAIKKDK